MRKGRLTCPESMGNGKLGLNLRTASIRGRQQKLQRLAEFAWPSANHPRGGLPSDVSCLQSGSGRTLKHHNGRDRPGIGRTPTRFARLVQNHGSKGSCLRTKQNVID
jgi:hypothetical protein